MASAGALIDAAAVARSFGVSRDWVYAHTDELGAVRLGSGPKARLRFDPEEVKERLAQSKPGTARRRRRRLKLASSYFRSEERPPREPVRLRFLQCHRQHGHGQILEAER